MLNNISEVIILRKLPPIGARIIKSSVAVALCMIVYCIRTLLPIGSGIPFYSALAALWCMQPYADTTKNNADQRTVGTLTGAAFGIIFLLVLRVINQVQPIFDYLLASLVIIPVIYTTVLINKRNAAFFSCVVFLSIALTHSYDENPYLFVFNRILDTFIGILIGVGVNDFHLPIRHDNETLYVSGIDDVLISSDRHSTQYSKVELNRLIKSGVRFTVSTVRTPAEIMSIMNGVELKHPVIVMDGAAIYDINEKQYIETVFLPHDICLVAEKIISDSGLHYFVNAMYDTTLLIYYGELKNSAERDLFETHRHSPFRNYIRSSFRYKNANEKVLYLTVLAEENKISELETKLRIMLTDKAKITVSFSEYEGFLYLKVLSIKASKADMIKKLQKYTNTDKVITFGSIKGNYDVYINDGGGNATIKKLKKIYRKR